MGFRTLGARVRRSPARLVAVAALALLVGATGIALPATALDEKDPGAAIVASADGNGYALISAAGKRYAYGSSTPDGGLPGRIDLDVPVVAAADRKDGGGWLATRDGAVFPVGGAPALGSLVGGPAPVELAAISPTRTGRGYWLATTSGSVAAFGDARSLGSLAPDPRRAPVVGMASTPSGRGYWLATADGAVFPFGDAPALGAPITERASGDKPEPAPLVALLASDTGRGYLAVADDGTTYAFGDFPDPGTLADMTLTSPVVDAARYSDAPGHAPGVWLLLEDGGVVSLRAPFYGSAVDAEDPKPARVRAPYYTGGVPVVSGTAGGLVAVPCSGADGVVVVSAVLARGVAGLIADAERDGVPLCATSSYRNSQQQIALRKAYCTDVFDPKATCSRPVALPGLSRHEQGLAVDFRTSAGGYAWLATHAPARGLQHLKAYGDEVEPWHYSIDGG